MGITQVQAAPCWLCAKSPFSEGLAGVSPVCVHVSEVSLCGLQPATQVVWASRFPLASLQEMVRRHR